MDWGNKVYINSVIKKECTFLGVVLFENIAKFSTCTNWPVSCTFDDVSNLSTEGVECLNDNGNMTSVVYEQSAASLSNSSLTPHGRLPVSAVMLFTSYIYEYYHHAWPESHVSTSLFVQSNIHQESGML